MKEETKKRPLNDDELSDVQIKNIDLLNKHHDEIMSDITQVLSKYNIDLSLSSLILSPPQDAERQRLASGWCCCVGGYYANPCSLCNLA